MKHDAEIEKLQKALRKEENEHLKKAISEKIATLTEIQERETKLSSQALVGQSALVNCPVCNHSISGLAVVCPGCGIPFKRRSIPVSIISESHLTIMDGLRVGIGFAVILPIVLLIIGFVGMIFGVSMCSELGKR